MGGKRPDQYRIDPGEGGATDYKSRRMPEKGLQAEQDYERVANQSGEGESLIPERHDNPALAELKERKAQSDADRQDELDRGKQARDPDSGD